MNQIVYSKSIIYTSAEDREGQAKLNKNATLEYHGFTPPEKVEARGKSLHFASYYATLYGDLHSASVMVLCYHHYSEKINVVYLLYKHGKTVELRKRGDHKALYTRAEELVEASKDA